MNELSPKEILLSVACFCVALALAIFINPFVKDAMYDEIRVYQNALQVDGDSGQFQYAYTTKVGNVFAYGRMTAVNPVVIPELLGQYGLVEKVEEEYTRHTRQVCNAHDKNGNCTSYRTEVYYTWDKNGSFTFASSHYSILSVPLAYTNLEIEASNRLELSQNTVTPQFSGFVNDNCIYEKNSWWDSVGDLRWYYRVLPIDFGASVFANFDSQELHAKVYYEQNRDQVLAKKEADIKTFDVFYYLIWVGGVVGLWLYWAYHHGEIE